MKVAIIGAGFTGLAAAYDLVQRKYETTVFESESRPGGLAIGFKEPEWKWSLESHYHHLFTSDNSIIDLANEVDHKLNYLNPVSSTYVNGKIVKLDSPIDVLKFNELPLIDRTRLGVGLSYLKYNP